jgi:hypothetical protein
MMLDKRKVIHSLLPFAQRKITVVVTGHPKGNLPDVLGMIPAVQTRLRGRFFSRRQPGLLIDAQAGTWLREAHEILL